MFKSFFFRDEGRSEAVAFFFLLIFLSTDAVANATVGFSLAVFLATVVPSAMLAFLYPRSGLAASVVVTILFERFFTLAPVVVGEATYKIYPLDMMLVPVFVSSLFLWIRDGRHRFRFRMTDGLPLIFFGIVSVIFLVGAFGIGGEQGFSVAFSTWKNYVFYGMIFFATALLVRTGKDMRIAAKLFLATVATAGIFLVIGLVRGGGLWTEYTPLSTPGTRFLAFPHAFSFSLALLSVLLFLPYRPADGNRSGFRYWSYPFVALLAAGILGSLMRHLWIGVAATLSAAVLVAPKRSGKPLGRFMIRFAFPVMTFAMLGIAVFSALPESLVGNAAGQGFSAVKERVLSIGSGTDESLAWREAVWESALSRFSEHPFRGVGFGASVPVELGEYREYVEIRNMHNSWLALLIQTGIFGTVAFFAFLASLVSGSFRADVRDPFLKGMRTALFGALLFQFLVFFSQPYLETNLLSIFFWVTLGLIRVLPETDEAEYSLTT